MYVFTRKSVIEVQFVILINLQNTDQWVLFFIDNQQLIEFLHNQNWAVFTDERFYALMRHHVLLAIETKLKQAKFYYFLVAIDSMTKSLQACGKRRETLKFLLMLLCPNISS